MTGSLLLTRDLDMPFPEPQWPEGIAPAPFTEADAAACHKVLQRAYGQGDGDIVSSLDDWWRSTDSDPEFDPQLVFLAKAEDGTVAGLAICWTSSFVKDIVVDPEFQRQGIGEALLLTAIAALKRRGHSRIGLKLQADNTSGARRLYDRLGFVLG
jgi:ribosomal protein S18 acetylase RimI-like enzyme